MHIHTYIYIYIYTYIYIYISKSHMYLYVCVCVCVYANVNVYVLYMRTCVCVCVRVYMGENIFLCMGVCIGVFVYIHTYIHVYTWVHISCAYIMWKTALHMQSTLFKKSPRKTGDMSSTQEPSWLQAKMNERGRSESLRKGIDEILKANFFHCPICLNWVHTHLIPGVNSEDFSANGSGSRFKYIDEWTCWQDWS